MSSQILFLVLGVVAMAVITNIPVGWYHKQVVVNAMLAVALVLQLAVVVIGVEVNGNRNWIKLGPVQMQPSEFSKLAIVMWLAWVYNRQGDISRSLWRTLFPSIYGVGALILLIMVGGDMGTALVYGFIFLGMMWMAGASRRSMLQIGGAVAALALLGVLSSPNRVARIFGIWGSCTNANCDQANSGEVALATGGFLGVGLGQSRQKYNYLAEAHNDYIFAIIGEELGLLGTMAVLLLYVGLVYCAVRIMLRTADPAGAPGDGRHYGVADLSGHHQYGYGVPYSAGDWRAAALCLLRWFLVAVFAVRGGFAVGLCPADAPARRDSPVER